MENQKRHKPYEHNHVREKMPSPLHHRGYREDEKIFSFSFPRYDGLFDMIQIKKYTQYRFLINVFHGVDKAGRYVPKKGTSKIVKRSIYDVLDYCFVWYGNNDVYEIFISKLEKKGWI